VLGQPPPPAFLEALTGRGVPISVGHCIVATVEPFEHEVLSALKDLALEWHLIFNKGSVMALPADITKATGLAPALAALGVPAWRTIGVGDAENDQAFLRVCGLSVAVANALPSVKEIAHLVTSGARGAGVVELIDELLAGRLVAPQA
jgi:hydroxymethylpyrimidine pyrophosphatase-like HAD family hydrolase